MFSNSIKLALPFLLMSLTACAGIDLGNNNYQLTVDALAVDNALDYDTYYLKPAAGIEQGLEYDHFAEQVENTLDSKGLIKAASPDQAQATVVLSYKVGPKQQYQYVTSVPMWGPAGYPFPNTGFWVGHNYYPGGYGPYFGASYYQQVTGVDTVYPMKVKLAAQSKQGQPIWEISITANSETGDLRKTFHYFMRAAQPYIGANTAGKQSVSVSR